MKRLVKGLVSYGAFTLDNSVSICDDNVKFPLSTVTYFIPTVTDKYSYLKSLLKLPNVLYSTFITYRNVKRKYNIKFIISTGPGLCINVSMISKLFWSRPAIIYIETWSRFYSKSVSGAIMYYLADYFFVQNRSLTKLYKRAIYKGRL